MLRNLLEALEQGSQLRHVALVTGLKHYMGPFEAYALDKPDTPFPLPKTKDLRMKINANCRKRV